MPNYRVAPIFLIRAAGVPFEILNELTTPQTCHSARLLLRQQNELSEAKSTVASLLRSNVEGSTHGHIRAWRKALQTDALPKDDTFQAVEFVRYRDRLLKQAEAESILERVLSEELETARAALITASRRFLPSYLVFGVGGVRELVSKLQEGSSSTRENITRRNAREGDRERHLQMYLQRICGKNDTFSGFGPSAWGKTDRDMRGIAFGEIAHISRRHSLLERWVATAVTAVLNQDPETRLEIAPRINPNGRCSETAFTFTDTGEKVDLDLKSAEFVQRCNGRAPAFILGQIELLVSLAQKGVIQWQIEVPALKPNPFEILLSDVRNWRTNATQARWLGSLEAINTLSDRFAKVTSITERFAVMHETRERLDAIGIERKQTKRSLYSASNPILEECLGDGLAIINEKMFDDLARDSEPWLDLWRDTYAYVASQVNTGLRRLFKSAPVKNAAVSLPAFLRHCANNKLALEGPGLVVLAHLAFQEVKEVFCKSLPSRLEMEELELGPNECHFLRRDCAYEKFDEYTYPSADLQISAISAEAVTKGEYQWILSELHPPLAMLHHCFYWGCPDKPALSTALRSTVGGRPNFHFGFGPADFTSHTTVRIFDALPDLTYFVAPQRGDPEWKTVPPAEAEVFVDDDSGDVGLRRRGTHEYLGSFARAWLIPLGFHPFHFGRAPHMPRLRCGNVIVQRQSWTVTLDELTPGDFTGISTHLVVAIEKLRAEKNWPRHIYIRPTEQALRRSGAEGRDKDTKPVFIDLESYLSMEIFYRWLKKANELEVTEMLPDADHLCWQEADGRRTFELRTLIVPQT